MDREKIENNRETIEKDRLENISRAGADPEILVVSELIERCNL